MIGNGRIEFYFEIGVGQLRRLGYETHDNNSHVNISRDQTAEEPVDREWLENALWVTDLDLAMAQKGWTSGLGFTCRTLLRLIFTNSIDQSEAILQHIPSSVSKITGRRECRNISLPWTLGTRAFVSLLQRLIELPRTPRPLYRVKLHTIQWSFS